MFDRVTVRRLVFVLMGSGLSLGRLFTLPLGGLSPKFGSVVILSILGVVYAPKMIGSVLWYCCSPKCFVQSSTSLCLSLTWYFKSGSCDCFLALQLFLIDLIVAYSSVGGYMMPLAFV